MKQPGVCCGILALLTAAVVGGCASVGSSSTGGDGARSALMPEHPDALIQMRRSDCPSGGCSVYGVAIFMDGTVVYDGRANVHVVGQRQGKISAQGISDLISALDTMDFLDTPASCCTCPAASPYQIITLDYRPGSGHRCVIHDSGCASAPAAMSALERTIDQVSGVDRWIVPTVAIAQAVTDSPSPKSAESPAEP